MCKRARVYISLIPMLGTPSLYQLIFIYLHAIYFSFFHTDIHSVKSSNHIYLTFFKKIELVTSIIFYRASYLILQQWNCELTLAFSKDFLNFSIKGTANDNYRFFWTLFSSLKNRNYTLGVKDIKTRSKVEF